MELKQNLTCLYCGEKEAVTMITKETKYSRSIKITKCVKCKRQNGIKAILTESQR